MVTQHTVVVRGSKLSFVAAGNAEDDQAMRKKGTDLKREN